jgi:hypothetical protein
MSSIAGWGSIAITHPNDYFLASHTLAILTATPRLRSVHSTRVKAGDIPRRAIFPDAVKIAFI